MTRYQATETKNIIQSRDLLTSAIRWVDIVLERLSPYLSGLGCLKILEIGSAQGRALIGLSKSGHKSYGVEPYLPAIQVARQLAVEENAEIYVIQARAEEIPFQSNYFDLVLAFSVMEHVEDLNTSLTEIARVLKPGGLFWFNSASSMCPIQGEISGFPLFGWYPDHLKKKIMLWAKINRPELIGSTEHPAMHWWTPYNASRRLKAAGFTKVWDRWDLRIPAENHGFLGDMIGYAKRFYLLHIFGDILSSGCSYAARKSIVNKLENGS
jgi:2-polyprenyl-6-hydroxyphenyl methylase/3-demethylubiquinone-9 3-methyltransferase